MANQSKSHITLLLDRSGSMSSVKDDVIGAVNDFVKQQQAVPGECTFTLVQFDSQDPYEVVQNAVPIADAKPLTAATYAPRASTPLLDAFGRAMVNTGDYLSGIPEDQRPGKVVFVVQTDGAENASREFTKSKIAEMVKTQTETYQWQFVFLGANIDAIGTGASLGISSAGSIQNVHSGSGIRAAFRATGQNVASYRSGPGGQSIQGYSDDQRAEAMKT